MKNRSKQPRPRPTEEGKSFIVQTAGPSPNPRDASRPLVMWKIVDCFDDECIASGIAYHDDVDRMTTEQIELLVIMGNLQDHTIVKTEVGVADA